VHKTLLIHLGVFMPQGYRYTQSEEAAIVSKFQNGTLKRVAFCKVHRISPNTLKKFIFNSKNNSSLKSEFLPVILKTSSPNKSSSAILSQELAVRVNFASGVTASIPSILGSLEIAKILRGLI